MVSFTEVYQIYAQRVYRFLLALSGSEQQTEELTQEVFYRALLHIDRYRDQGTMLTWLCTIGKNLWLSECRMRGRFIPLDDTPPLSIPGPEESIQERERQRALRRAIIVLPEEQRDVLILHIYGGIPLKDIAALKNRSESWGKVTFYRARQKLARELEGFK